MAAFGTGAGGKSPQTEISESRSMTQSELQRMAESGQDILADYRDPQSQVRKMQESHRKTGTGVPSQQFRSPGNHTPPGSSSRPGTPPDQKRGEVSKGNTLPSSTSELPGQVNRGPQAAPALVVSSNAPGTSNPKDDAHALIQRMLRGQAALRSAAQKEKDADKERREIIQRLNEKRRLENQARYVDWRTPAARRGEFESETTGWEASKTVVRIHRGREDDARVRNRYESDSEGSGVRLSVSQSQASVAANLNLGADTSGPVVFHHSADGQNENSGQGRRGSQSRDESQSKHEVSSANRSRETQTLDVNTGQAPPSTPAVQPQAGAQPQQTNAAAAAAADQQQIPCWRKCFS